MHSPRPNSALTAATLVLGLAALAVPALAQPGPDGIDWVTIGAVGNRGYDGPDPTGQTLGRGSVGYEFKIGRYEVTAAQWGEFFNAALNRSDPIGGIYLPSVWAGYHPLPGREMYGVGGITWRTAAIFCNWMHNNKATDQDAFFHGAYEASTFNYVNGIFTDQPEHSPGARYWIPTLDEWLKASHFDPSKANPDGSTGGWWQYSTSSDSPPLYGPPPGFPNGNTANQANAGFSLPNDQQFQIPLGAYTETTSPWGLYDVAGGTSEWTEGIETFSNGRNFRQFVGSSWASPTGNGQLDRVWEVNPQLPSFRDDSFGFRIASAVPAPATAILSLVFGLVTSPRRRRLR